MSTTVTGSKRHLNINADEFAGDLNGTVNTATTAVTQSANNNSTKVATTAYVDAQVATIVDSAPGTLNTLNELAAALGDDASFSTTVTDSIAAKLPLAGGTMSGDIVMGDNDITGVKFIQANDNVDLRTGSGEYALHANQDGQVALYNNGVKKFETMSTGATVISSTATFLIEGDGVTSSNLKFRSNSVDRWNVNVPSGQTNLAFTTGSTNVLSLDTSNNATFAGSITGKDSGIIIDSLGGPYGRIHGTSSIFLGGGSTSQVQLSSALIPDGDSTRSLGSGSRYWSHTYTDAITTTGKIQCGGELEGASLDINGNAAIDGSLSGTNNIIYGANATGTTQITGTTLDASSMLKSGFYRVNNSGSTIPNSTNVNFLMHTSYDGITNQAGFDLAANDSTTSQFYLRPATGGGKGAWQTIITDVGTQTISGAKTFTGTVALTGTGRITGIDTVTASTDAASKAYVDGAVIANTDTQDLSISGTTLSLTNSPSVTIPQRAVSTSVSSTSTTVAATSSAVKSAYDRGSTGTTNAAGAQTTANAAPPKAGGTMSGAINMGNNNISGVNAIQMADPGPSEGVTWTNTKIFESPNDLTTNTAGNFQVVHTNTRRLTVDNAGIDVNGNIVVSGTVDGRDIAADGTKLDTIDTNADVTPSWVPSSDPGYLTSDSDTQDLSISGQVISLTNGGSVTIPTQTSVTGNAGTATALTNGNKTINGDLTVISNSDGILNLRQSDVGSSSGTAEGGWNYIQFQDAQGDRQAYFGIDSNGNLLFAPEVASSFVRTTSAFVAGGTITAQNGNIILSGTGRIQGIDTVTSSTDAASKAYVDGAVIANTDTQDLSISGRVISLTNGGSVTVPETTIPTIPSGNAIIDWTAENAGTIHTSNYIENVDYELPTAAANTLGGIKVGSNLSISATGVLSATDSNTVYTHPTTAGNKHIPSGGGSGQFLKYSSSGTAVWATPSYIANTDTNKFLSGISKSSNTLTFAVTNGTNQTYTFGANAFNSTTIPAAESYTQHENISAASSNLNNSGRTYIQDITLDSNGHVTGVATATETVTDTTYNTATSSALGLVKIGYSENGKNYPVELSSGKMFVNVPWENTQTADTFRAVEVDSSGNGSADYTLGSTETLRFKRGSNVSLEESSGVVTISSTDTTYSVGNGGLTQNNLTNTLKGNYDTAYTHSQASHAPSNATANSSDATLKARANHTGTQAASTISDFDTEVANNSAVAANTAKTSNIVQTSVSGNAGSVTNGVYTNTTQTISGAKTFSSNTVFSGAISQSNTTQSTTKSTGAYKTSGGVGIAKTLNVGEDVVAYASSDKRYKDNLQAITNPIDKVKSLTGYTFTWNDKHEQFNGNDDIGIVAQEVEKVFPEIVDTRDNGYKAVKYEKMVAVLIEAIKDQQKQIDELKEKLNGNS